MPRSGTRPPLTGAMLKVFVMLIWLDNATELHSTVAARFVSCALGDIRHELPRQQEAERTLKQAEEERQAQARSLDEQIAAAVAAAMKARPPGTTATARSSAPRR